jgi:hypothetical protein
MEVWLGFAPLLFITLNFQSTTFECQMFERKRGCFEEVGCFVGEGFCLMLDVLKQSGALF